MGKTFREFTPECKDEAVKLGIDTGRSVATVARELGFSEVPLGWLAGYRSAMAATTVLFDRPALVLIDVQQGFDDVAFWGERDNPLCEDNIAALLQHWRGKGWPVVFVQHDSDNPGSPLAPTNPSHAFKDIITGPPDLLVRKRVNSSFYGTPDLHQWFQIQDITQVVICGITTNHCCETTARMAGNLGYDTYFAIDATHTFDRAAPDGTLVTAETLSAITAVNLHEEFATVMTTHALLAR